MYVLNEWSVEGVEQVDNNPIDLCDKGNGNGSDVEREVIQ